MTTTLSTGGASITLTGGSGSAGASMMHAITIGKGTATGIGAGVARQPGDCVGVVGPETARFSRVASACHTFVTLYDDQGPNACHSSSAVEEERSYAHRWESDD